MKIRTRTENEEGMRQAIARAMLRHEERVALRAMTDGHNTPFDLPPAGETIDDDIAFSAVAEESDRLPSAGLLAPSPRTFSSLEVAHA